MKQKTSSNNSAMIRVLSTTLFSMLAACWMIHQSGRAACFIVTRLSAPSPNAAATADFLFRSRQSISSPFHMTTKPENNDNQEEEEEETNTSHIGNSSSESSHQQLLSLEDRINEFLDTPFFDPSDETTDHGSPLMQWYADLVRNDYQAAESIYVGVIMVFLIVVSQELLRMQMFGDAYIPFASGGGGGGFY